MQKFKRPVCGEEKELFWFQKMASKGECLACYNKENENLGGIKAEVSDRVDLVLSLLGENKITKDQARILLGFPPA